MSKTEKNTEGQEVQVRFASTVPRHTREFSAKDFKTHGVEHKAVKCLAGEVISVSEEAAKVLVDDLGEFERVTDAEKVEAPDELAVDLSETVPPGEDNSGGGTQGSGNARDGAGARGAQR